MTALVDCDDDVDDDDGTCTTFIYIDIVNVDAIYVPS